MKLWRQMRRVQMAALAIFSIMMFGVVTPAGVVFAQDDIQKGACKGLDAAGVECTDGKTAGGGDAKPIVAVIIDTLSVVGGAVAVIMIIVGGLRYILASGDSNAVSGAKNTILYAVVGLVIILFAQVIVRFVYTAATTDSAPSSTPGGSGGSGGGSDAGGGSGADDGSSD